MAMPSPEVTIQSGVSVSKIGIIKVFKGLTPPVLKKGELATDGNSLFLKSNNGNIAKFLSTAGIMDIVADTIDNHIQDYHSIGK